MLEIVFDLVWVALRALESGAELGDHFGLVTGALTPEGVALHVLIEVFVGIQFGTVTGQQVQFDLGGVFL